MSRQSGAMVVRRCRRSLSLEVHDSVLSRVIGTETICWSGIRRSSDVRVNRTAEETPVLSTVKDVTYTAVHVSKVNESHMGKQASELLHCDTQDEPAMGNC